MKESKNTNIFTNTYTQNLTVVVSATQKVRDTVTRTYDIEDWNGTLLKEHFCKQELQENQQKIFRRNF